MGQGHKGNKEEILWLQRVQSGVLPFGCQGPGCLGVAAEHSHGGGGTAKRRKCTSVLITGRKENEILHK